MTTENRTGVQLPQKATWVTHYDDGSERTTLSVNVDAEALQVVLDPDGQQWASINPKDLVWLAARLLDAHAILTAREENRNG